MSWKDRVVDEAGELKGKLDKLNKFLDSDFSESLPIEEFDSLAAQAKWMHKYYKVLRRRIARFKREG